jgi:hypothetical protein
MKILTALFILSSTLISGCVSTYGGGSPDGVKIYTSTYSNSQDSFDRARTHCLQFDRDTEFVRSSRIPSFDEFQCVDRKEESSSDNED